MKAYNQVVKETTEKVIDMESMVPKNLDYFTDDVHYTERGSRLLAEIIAEEILRRKE